MLHAGAQIDIMRQAVRYMPVSDVTGASLTAIKDLVRRHQKIISLSNDIEKLYSPIALLQILWNTLIICCAGFLIIIVSTADIVPRGSTSNSFLSVRLQGLSKDEDGTDLSKSLLPGIVKILEVFVFCYAGEYLSAKVRKEFSHVLKVAKHFLRHA